MPELTQIGEILKGVEFVKKITPPSNYKEIPPNNKINFDLKKCKVLRDLIEYNQSGNCLNSTIIKHKGKTYMEKEFKNLSGYDYKVRSLSPFNKTLIDLKVLLVISYITDFFKRRFITISFTDFIKLLGVKDTGYYRKAIIDALDYYKNITYYTPYIWDLDKNKRNDDVPLTDKNKINWKKLSSLSVWSVINAYHLKNLNELQRKSRIEIEISWEYYHRFLNYYTLIDFKKAISLKNPTSLNLYLFVKNNWGIKRTHKYSIGFEKLKKDIGITDTNKSSAKDTFKKAWINLKQRGLLFNFKKHRLPSYFTYYFTPSKTGKENIHFKLTKVLKA